MSRNVSYTQEELVQLLHDNSLTVLDHIIDGLECRVGTKKALSYIKNERALYCRTIEVPEREQPDKEKVIGLHNPHTLAKDFLIGVVLGTPLAVVLFFGLCFWFMAIWGAA